MIARQEVVGRVGIALSPEEEAARARLQELASQLAAPPLYNVSITFISVKILLYILSPNLFY